MRTAYIASILSAIILGCATDPSERSRPIANETATAAPTGTLGPRPTARHTPTAAPVPTTAPTRTPEPRPTPRHTPAAAPVPTTAPKVPETATPSLPEATPEATARPGRGEGRDQPGSLTARGWLEANREGLADGIIAEVHRRSITVGIEVEDLQEGLTASLEIEARVPRRLEDDPEGRAVFEIPTVVLFATEYADPAGIGARLSGTLPVLLTTFGTDRLEADPDYSGAELELSVAGVPVQPGVTLEVPDVPGFGR